MMDPPTCVPIAAGIIFAATAAAEPEDEPPGVRRASNGLVVGPGCAMPNSAVTVLPMMMAPASRKARTMMLSRFGKLPVKAPQRARNVAAQAGVAGSVLESYRDMLAFRRVEWALRHGRSRFLDLPEPVLAFQRGEGDGALLCLYNLSPRPVRLTLTGCGALTGPAQAAERTGDVMALGPNGYAFARPDGAAAMGATLSTG